MKMLKNNRTKGITNLGAIVVIIAAIIVAVPVAWYLAGAPPRIVTEIVEEPTSLRRLAEMIRNGTIDVGTEYSMNITGRYHTIHGVLGSDCATCHVAPQYDDDYLYQRKYKEPDLNDSGIVDRGRCLSCHKEGGTASELYGDIGK
jgi:hypothetical protein